MGRINEKSIVQAEKRCWLCHNINTGLLERHEAFGGARRKLSIKDKLTVLLCGDSCHRNGQNAVHQNKDTRLRLQRASQWAAMRHYGWTVEQFAARYGKNYLDESELDIEKEDDEIAECDSPDGKIGCRT